MNTLVHFSQMRPENECTSSHNGFCGWPGDANYATSITKNKATLKRSLRSDKITRLPQFTAQRQDLLGQVSDVGYDVASMNSKDLCHLLLYGNPNESTFANSIILEATISFIKTSGRFN